MIQKRTLKGHRKPVLCLAHSSERILSPPPSPPPSSSTRRLGPDDDIEDECSYDRDDLDVGNDANDDDDIIIDDDDRTRCVVHPCLLLSGSEDGTARLWDLRARRASLCIVVPRGGGDGNDHRVDDDGGISCVAFHPSMDDIVPTSTKETTDTTTRMGVGGVGGGGGGGRDDDDDDDGDHGMDGRRGGAGEEEDVTYPNILGGGACTAYVAAGGRVYAYDLRMTSTSTSTHALSPTIVRAPHFDLTNAFGCVDEINQLSFSYPTSIRGGGRGGGGRRGVAGRSNARHYLLATADDNCDVRVLYDPPHAHTAPEEEGRGGDGDDDVDSGPSMLLLRHAEAKTMAIASCAAFRPRHRIDGYGNDAHEYLATAGTDCTVKLWDVVVGGGGGRRRRRPTSVVTIGPRSSDNDHLDDAVSSVRFCNPPYVHSLSWSMSGRYLAAGVGDGSVMILRAVGHRLVEIGRYGSEIGGHASAVAAVRFANFGPRSSSKWTKRGGGGGAGGGGNDDDRLLISAGNDGNLIFWDLGSDVAGSGSLDPRVYLGGCLSSSSYSSSSSPPLGEKGVDEVNDGMAGMGLASPPSPPRPEVLFKIAHRHKPNWITCGGTNDVDLPKSLFVADTTNDISVYTLPP